MTKRTYRFDIAYPAELEQLSRHFASGVNNPGEARGLAMSGRQIGIAATEIRAGLLEELENYGGPGMQELFVDSGAFSEVKFTAAGRKVVKPITHDSWMKRFEIYYWAANTYGRRARLVAPDCVGDQDETLARLARYAPMVAACAAMRAQIIVPVQKGALPMSEMFRQACAILNLREMPIAGIPMKKDATSLADLAELVDSLPWYGARLHLLGLGPESKRYAKVIRLIKSKRPNATLTSDSVTVRRLVGRKNGRGNGPRVLTRLQDEARAMGLTGHEVKAHALTIQGWDEADRQRARAAELGWRDVELDDDEGAEMPVAEEAPKAA